MVGIARPPCFDMRAKLTVVRAGLLFRWLLLPALRTHRNVGHRRFSLCATLGSLCALLNSAVALNVTE